MASEGQYFGGNVALLGKLGVGTLTPTEKIEVDGNVSLTDNSKLLLGGGDDLQIYHDGTNSKLLNTAGYLRVGTSSGILYLDGNNTYIRSGDGGEYQAKFIDNGQVELFYNNVKKFETTDTGATITGKLIVNGDLDVSGTTTTFNSTVVTVDDPVFTVGGDSAPDASDNKDRGIEFRYFRSGESAKVGFFGYDNSENAFTFLTDATNNSEVFSGTLGNLKTKDITLSGGTLQLDSAYAIQWGNGNNRIFGSSGNNYIRFDTNGTEAARFDSSQNFVIGATTASAKLDVQLEAGAWNVGSSFSNKAVRISGGSGGLGLAYDDTTGATIAAIHHGNSWKKLNFGAVEYHYDINGSEVMRLNSTGLGIGVSPSAKFDLLHSQTQSGSTAVATILSNATTTATSTQSSATYKIQNYLNLTGTGGSFQNSVHQQVMTTVSSTGTATNFKNHVSRVHTSGSGQINSVSAYNVHTELDGDGTISKWMGYAIADGTLSTFTNTGHTITNTYGLYIGDLTSGTQTNTPYGVYQANTDMINYFGGKVGIGGVNSPSDFNSSANNLVIGSGSGTQGLTIYGGSSGGSYIYFSDGTTGSDPYEGFLQYRHTERALRFGVAAGPRMTLDANGSLGIATTAPSSNADLTLGNGELCIAETTTPTADANFGKVYCKSDNKLYFQDGAGTEHEIAFA